MAVCAAGGNTIDRDDRSAELSMQILGPPLFPIGAIRIARVEPDLQLPMQRKTMQNSVEPNVF